jgi:hypothetical protein
MAGGSCETFEVRTICKPQLDYTQCTADQKLQEEYAAHVLDLNGANINVFKMLGVHEQKNDVDITGDGYPIASGTVSYANIGGPVGSGPQVGPYGAGPYEIGRYDATDYVPWASSTTGDQITNGSTWYGYCFGIKRTSYGASKYEPGRPVMMNAARIKIRQGGPAERVLQARVESSNDGVNWTRVDVINLPNTGDLETIHIRQSAIANCWRLVPLLFTGGTDDRWTIREFRIQENYQTSLANVQDVFLLENRDRAYATESVTIRCQVTPTELNADLSRFGIELPETYEFEASFMRVVEALGRNVVVGDLLELPFDAQYDRNLRKVKSYMEVTDVDWAADGYATNWNPIMVKFWAKPAMSTQETRDVLGLPENFQDLLSGGQEFCDNFGISLMASESTKEIRAEAADDLPETGVNILEGTSARPTPAKRKDQYDGSGPYVEDGIPPDGKPYTEGPVLPVPTGDGVFHRLTYPGTDLNTRLFIWSALKNRWIFLEEDKRGTPSSHKPTVKKLMSGQALSKVMK